MVHPWYLRQGLVAQYDVVGCCTTKLCCSFDLAGLPKNKLTKIGKEEGRLWWCGSISDGFIGVLDGFGWGFVKELRWFQVSCSPMSLL